MQPGKAFDLIRESSPTLSVGIMSADLMCLRSAIEVLENTGIIMIHYDVMDGCFVPMMTAGPPLVKGIKTTLLKDVHLMISDPYEKVDDYVKSGADIVVVHIESCEDIKPVLKKLGTMKNANNPEKGIIRGIAINPPTPVTELQPLLDDVEMISVLAVDPKELSKGFFDTTPERFDMVREMVKKSGNDILLCLDGGVKVENIAALSRLGADFVVSGSAVFGGKGPQENIRYMLETLHSQKTETI